MIPETSVFKVLHAPHVSEKASVLMEKNNTFVLKVAKNSTKRAIKNALLKLFTVKVKKIHTIVVKGKVKRHGRRIGLRSDWKKAYITLTDKQNLDFISSSIK
ncbi:50S ribosomal protein L23 [Candidatus Palibaumannia cicadellinicola]|uniref:Large ribosomal subunit protein uL23 n=1 Tax=Candidatus Palibaumannia cicadellinicola TaxID=186490 RepID=A0A0K2BKZ5_9GAMM|nr:50S ribosomal protein L23 [Candidatus Baumannia cicadellinicola]AKZ65874.1 LSU ribosomal protein L23p (L23Ae) [Candidatus Baumannia cicadellinicola]